MALRVHIGVAVALLVVWALLTAAVAIPATLARRHCFPRDFLFGAGISGYQVAGGESVSGRVSSAWDAYCRVHPSDQCDDVTAAFRHYYRQDVATVARMELQSFRFSVSWARVMSWDPTTGRMRPNPEGIAFYRLLLDELAGHYTKVILIVSDGELPLALKTELGGWRHPDVIDHFAQFASLLFREFGGHVAYWTTFSDPLAVATVVQGQEKEDPYTIAHHLLLAHARAVQTFRNLQLGVSAAAQRAPVSARAHIGLALGRTHYYPLDPKNKTDVQAAARALDFDVGWFLEPLVSGDYPASMKRRVGERLPKFTTEQKRFVRGSYDVLMLSHFQSCAVTNSILPHEVPAVSQWHTDRGVDDSHAMPGTISHSSNPSGANISHRCEHLSAYPPGYLAAIKWLHSRDSHAPILLTANGWCGDTSAESAARQLEFFQQSLLQVHAAVTDLKIPIVGYTAWSLLDDYSDGHGFGLYAVEPTSTSSSTTDTRVSRAAAPWFARVASTKCLPLDEVTNSSRNDGGDHDPSLWALVLLGVALTMVVGTLYVLLCRVMGRAIGRWSARRRGDATPEELSPLL